MRFPSCCAYKNLRHIRTRFLVFATIDAQNSLLPKWITQVFWSHFLRSCIVPIRPWYVCPTAVIILIIVVLSSSSSSSSSSWMSDRFRNPSCSDMLHCRCAVISYPYRLAVNFTGKNYFARKNRIKSRTSWHLVSTCLAVVHLLIFFIPCDWPFRRLLHVTLTVSATLFDTKSCRLGNLNLFNIPRMWWRLRRSVRCLYA